MKYALLSLLLLCLSALTGCGRNGATAPGAGTSTGSLLSGARPAASSGARGTERLTDGVTAVDGDHWRTDVTATLSGPDAWIQYDLGKDTAIRAVFLQGDNNDRYILTVSSDGKTFAPLWTAPPSGRAGMRPRSNGNLNKSGRYVRLSASGGDGSYALSELALYSERPQPFPPKLVQRKGVPAEESLRSTIIWFGVALSAFAWLTTRRFPLWANALLLIIPLGALTVLYSGLDALWPVEQREISLLRATVAAVALACVLREAIAPRFWPAERRAVIATLSVSAALALACFFNLGRPQFWDAKQGQPSLIHNYDMRVYFPIAKYFDELEFDGLYLASVGAFFDDVPTASAKNYGNVELRDLKTHRTKRVAEVTGEIAEVKRRFSPERWEDFKRDMRYFRETMGLGAYLGTLTDHGGNATPVWFTIGHLMFAKAHASNTTLLIGGMLDPLLLLGAFIAIGFCFGWRTALVSATVFGANDYYMFGSNWAGATLRHDWMAALAFGACALKRERWVLGGVCFAYSALIRAFPALALMAMVLPAGWWVYGYRKEHASWPSFKLFLERQRPLLIVLGSAAAFALLMVVISSILLGPSSWVTWLHKVQLLDRGAHVNHVSMRALIGYHPANTLEALARDPNAAGWGWLQQYVLRSRAPLLLAGALAYGALVVRAARDKRLEQAAILGLFLVPVAFNPANYYIHLIFVFPLLVIERFDASGKPLSIYSALVWVFMLGICTAQYQTVLEPHLDKHFYQAAVILFIGLIGVLLSIIVEDQLARRAPALATPPGSPDVAPAELAHAADGEPASAPVAPADAHALEPSRGADTPAETARASEPTSSPEAEPAEKQPATSDPPLPSESNDADARPPGTK